MEMPFDPAHFCKDVLESNGIASAFGVPDSSLSGLLSFFAAEWPAPRHIVAANEGAAIALSAGHYLASGKISMAYMQNSGFSNALNPLQSLAAKEVFGIPMLLMIGWRGKPGMKDEPQHALIGPRLLDILTSNGITYRELPIALEGARNTIAHLVETANKKQSPVALIVPPGAFKSYQRSDASNDLWQPPQRVVGELNGRLCSESGFPLTRESAIRCILDQLDASDLTVSSLGGNSREVYMIRKEKGQTLDSNFFCIGAMGHAYALAYGVATVHKRGRVVCIDGDGSFVMHAGNNAVLTGISPKHLVHIVIYNGMHSSTGSQPLMLSKHHLLRLVNGLAYEQKLVVQTEDALRGALRSATRNTAIVVGVGPGVSKDLPRPKESPRELKKVFMRSFSAKL